MSDVVIVLLADFDRAAEGLAGAGRTLAAASGGRLHAITTSRSAGGELARVVDRVVLAEMEYQPESVLQALTQLCREIAPGAILLGNDAYSQELAPRLAHRLGGSAAGDATDVRRADGSVLVTRQVYGGKANAVLRLKRSPAVVSLRARSFASAAAADQQAIVEQASLSLSPDAPTRIVELKRESQSEARLEDARVIVSGGRGIGGVEGFISELRPLAELLGAQMAASRAACDAGWVPPTWQVGQTGKKVAPDLYLAVAITGASQHMAGISEARNIAAINIDPDAPIFRHARFGIVEDYRKVVPLLREKLKQLQR